MSHFGSKARVNKDLLALLNGPEAIVLLPYPCTYRYCLSPEEVTAMLRHSPEAPRTFNLLADPDSSTALEAFTRNGEHLIPHINFEG